MAEHTPTGPTPPNASNSAPGRMSEADWCCYSALAGAADALNALQRLPEGDPARALLPRAQALVDWLCGEVDERAMARTDAPGAQS